MVIQNVKRIISGRPKAPHREKQHTDCGHTFEFDNLYGSNVQGKENSPKIWNATMFSGQDAQMQGNKREID